MPAPRRTAWKPAAMRRYTGAVANGKVGTSPEKARTADSAIPAAEDPAAREYPTELRDELGRRIGRIERGMVLLKSAHGPAIPALLIKTALFS